MVYKKGSYKKGGRGGKGGKGGGSSKAATAAVIGVKAQRVSIQLLQDRVRDLESRVTLIERWYEDILQMLDPQSGPPAS